MITVKHMALWAALWLLAGCTVHKTVTIDPIHVEMDVDATILPSGETHNSSRGVLGRALDGIVEEAVLREGVAGDILTGSLAFLSTNGRWPGELGEIRQGLKAIGQPAHSLDKITAIQISEEPNGDCVIKYETAMPTKATLRLSLPDANDSE